MKYIPEVCWLEIYDNPLIKFPFIKLLDKTCTALPILQKRCDSVFNCFTRLERSKMSIVQIRFEYYCASLKPHLYEILLKDKSLSTQIFGNKFILNSISEYINKIKNNIIMPGKVITAEEYKHIIDEVL